MLESFYKNSSTSINTGQPTPLTCMQSKSKVRGDG